MLVLIGAGLGPGQLTLEAVKYIKGASVVYVDVYTMPGSSWLLDEARRLNSNVRAATRHDLESRSRLIVQEASEADVVILVPGDPLIATTHISLLVEASEMGVEYRYIPGVSGVCAAKAASGLHYYRFGRTITVPGPWRGVRPYSVLEAIYTNLCAGLHTLLLLDIDEGGKQLRPSEAASIIMTLEESASREAGVDPIVSGLPAIVVEAAGTGRQRVRVKRGLAEVSRAGGWLEPSSIIIPARLHETEKWSLEVLHGGLDGYDDEAHKDASSRACVAAKSISRLLGS